MTTEVATTATVGLSVLTTVAGGVWQYYVEATKSAEVIAKKFPLGFSPESQIIEGAIMAGIGVLAALAILRKMDLRDPNEQLLASTCIIPAMGLLTYAVSAILVGPVFHAVFGAADFMEVFRSVLMK